jgi:hypothetical protein
MVNYPFVENAQYKLGSSPWSHETAHRNIVAEIECWAEDFEKPPIYLLNQSNSGENTAIAQVIAETLSRKGKLGASFFCSQLSAVLCDVEFISPTLAVQLMRNFPKLLWWLPQGNISRMWCEGGREVGAMSPLVLNPCNSAGIRTVVIIDALEKCRVSDFRPLRYGSKFLSGLDQLRKPCNKHIKFLITATTQEEYMLDGFHFLNNESLIANPEALQVHSHTTQSHASTSSAIYK